MAIAATVNLVLVVFDLTYVPWRNFWLQSNIVIPITQQKIHLPVPTVDCPNRSVETGQPPQTLRQSWITCLYDLIKGIEPNRDTQTYLNTVAQLEQQVAQKGLESGLKSPEVQQLLATLRLQSEEMITLNPFEAVGKSGTLEKIKNEMQKHVGDRTKTSLSSKQAFNLFWSIDNAKYPNYLSETTWKEEIRWFNSRIKPLIATNYYRTIGENGESTNNFWIIDAPFVVLFLLEFLARTLYISRRYRSLTWLDAMIWRWYDVPMFLPFSLFAPVLALSRILPTMLRLHRAEIIDLHTINERIREGFVAAIAEEITEVVIVQVVNQVQAAILRGELTTLLQRTASRKYIDINNVNEIEELTKHLVQLVVYQVFPKIQPDLEELARHSIDGVLSQSPAYRGLVALPGIGTLPAQLTERLVADTTQVVYNSLKAILDDPQTTEMAVRLVQNFTSTLVSEAKQKQELEEIELLLSDLLEEIKINYIQRLTEEDTTLILDETRHLKRRVRSS